MVNKFNLESFMVNGPKAGGGGRGLAKKSLVTLW